MPIYEEKEYTKVLARIKGKAEARGLAMGNVLTEAEISDFEAQHGIQLPQAYRLFLKEVGDGCTMIDGFPLRPLREAVPCRLSQPFALEDPWIWEDEDIPQLTGLLDGRLGGQLELIDVGDGMSYNLIVTGACRGEVWSFADVGVQPCCERQDFLGWFELWLDQQDETDYFKDYGD